MQGNGDGMAQGLRLVDMPPEIIFCILAWISIRDRGACAIASPLLVGEHLATAAARCPSLSLPTLLAAGAPLDIVEKVVTWRGAIIRPVLLKPAVRGGRLDVIDWIHARLTGPIEVHCKSDDESEDEADYREHDHTNKEHPLIIPERKKSRSRESVRERRQKRRHRGHSTHKRRTGPTIAALYEAAYYGRATVLASLLDRYQVDFGGKHGQRLLYALTIEACTGPASGTDAIALLHSRSARLAMSGPCECSRDAGRAAASAERVDVLAWMRAVGCNARLNTKWEWPHHNTP